MLKSASPDSAQRIVISGMGIYSPCGKNIEQFSAALHESTTGIKEHHGVFEHKSVWAGIVEEKDHEQVQCEVEIDRTAQMGLIAAQEAVRNADVPIESQPERVALTLGTSHGGRSQLDQFILNGSREDRAETPQCLMKTAAHFQQTAAVASMLGIHGPTATLSNACSSSGAAVAYAVELIRSGKCDFAVAGGADGFSRLTYSGFAALGAMADGKCAPFSNPVGLSLGDGSAFVVLETLEHAEQRGANILAEIWGYGLSWDAYHITAPEPSGEGMNRAIRMAMKQSGLSPEQVDYINVHGTGTRSNDLAETVGLERFFGRESTPPVSATKSQTGHMLGASSVVGLIASILGMNDNWLPPTSNFTTTRSGCELDVVPNASRAGEWSCFLAQSAAFAGANAVIAGGRPSLPRVITEPEMVDDIVISGVGVVSPIGIGFDQFRESVNQQVSGISAIEQFDVSTCEGQLAGMVRDFQPRKLLPSVKLRRVDRVTAYATIASHLALQHADLLPLANKDRIGLVAGLCRGASMSYEKYLASVEGNQWEKASAVYFPNLVMSSVGGQVTAALGIQGITSTLVCPSGSGLQSLIHGMELFRRNRDQDALVVVASDELAPLYYRMLDKLGHRKLGEGSVAFVLERAQHVADRGGNALATLRGTGLTRDSRTGLTESDQSNDSSEWLQKAMQIALQEAEVSAAEIGSHYVGGAGDESLEAIENSASQTVFENQTITRNSVHALTGSAEACMSFFNAAAAMATATENQHAMLTASGDDGSHAALVMELMAAQQGAEK